MREVKEMNLEIGARIQRARESAGLTQAKFAEMIGMSDKNLSAVERGLVGISVGRLRLICETLSISSDTLLFDGLPAEDEELSAMTNRLKRLPAEERRIVLDIFNRLLAGFAELKKAR